MGIKLMFRPATARLIGTLRYYFCKLSNIFLLGFYITIVSRKISRI